MVLKPVSRLRFPWFLALFICFAFVLSVRAFASTYVPVGDDAYNMLFRLEAEGLITSGLLDILPISRREMQRLISEAERNAAASDHLNSEDREDISLLKARFGDEAQASAKYIKPLDEAYVRYVYASANPRENGLNYNFTSSPDGAGIKIPIVPTANPNGFVYNNNGDDYGKNSNFRLGFASLADMGWFSFYINPEYRYTDTTSQIDLNKIYGVFSALGLDLEVGRDSQWWGPGYNGELLVSDNSDPFTMIKLTNDRPAVLPWIFKYLGLTKFAFFVTKLDSSSINPPSPYMWGMRLDLKPTPHVEIGITRTALLCGEGRPCGFQDWLNTFTGNTQNKVNTPDKSGTERGSVDIKLTLPFKVQPAQVYFEEGAYDKGWSPKAAFLAGIYLPRILNIDRVDFRAEFATDHVPGHADVWYTHGYYWDTGWTYPADKDLIIGDPMGTDSDDLFLQTDYFIPKIGGRVYLSYDRERHNLSGLAVSGVAGIFQPVQNAVTLGADFYTMKNYSLNGQFTNGWITDTPQGRLDFNLFTLGITRYF